MSITIALVDDHQMLRNGLAEMLTNKGFKIIFEANNGKECIDALQSSNTIPDIVLLDITMPVMNGYETASWIKKLYPAIKILALTMYDTEDSIIRMLKCGARGYVLKEGNSRELVNALNTLYAMGYYSNDLITTKMINALQQNTDESTDATIRKLSNREIEFLQLCCSEMGYKEIAAKMSISQRTVDGFREGLFEKLNVHSRTGLVLYAIRNKIAKI